MQPQYITLPKQAKDITGQRFGRLVALGPIGKDASKNIIWSCQCDCGKITSVRYTHLRRGLITSCRCLFFELLSRRAKTHGLRHAPLYRTWSNIIHRCTNSSDESFANYGGRGISICDEWRHDFRSFHEHVSKLPHYREKGYTLDRINNDGNYEPNNLRWATRQQQNQNKRSNLAISFDGKTQLLAEWSKELGINYKTLKSRLRAGWSIERTFSTPTKR